MKHAKHVKLAFYEARQAREHAKQVKYAKHAI